MEIVNMDDFLDEVRGVQKRQLAKQKTPQQIYQELHQVELESSLAFIKNSILDEAKNNLTGKTLKGRIPLGGSRILARINRTEDVNTGYYTINRNYLVGDKDYTDYCTGNDYTWMYTAHLYEVNEDRGFFSNTCRITLTKRGQVFLEELKKMCAAQKITVKFCAHAAWHAANNIHNEDIFVNYGYEFKAKGKLVNVYPAVEYLVQL